MNQGYTFWLKDAAQMTHMWAVLSIPDEFCEQIVVVNFSSWAAYKDQSCIFEPCEHQSLPKKSVIMYDTARCWSKEYLVGAIANRHVNPDVPLSQQQVERVLEGAERSDRLPMKIRKVLIEQQLIV